MSKRPPAAVDEKSSATFGSSSMVKISRDIIRVLKVEAAIRDQPIQDVVESRLRESIKTSPPPEFNPAV